MAIKLKTSSVAPSPFTFDIHAVEEPVSLPSPPSSWLSAPDMKIFGSRPLTATSEIGLVKCKECGKPVLRSFMADHAGTLFVLTVMLYEISSLMTGSL